MATVDRETLLREVEGLPGALLQEVLDFIRFLKGRAGRDRLEPALLSEKVLSRDWLRPEEDEAWRDL
jgi:hypothetical protein